MVKRQLSRYCGALAALTLVLAASGCGSNDGSDDDTGSAGDTSGSSETAAPRTHAPQPDNLDGASCQYQPAGEPTKAANPPAPTAAFTGTVDVELETSVGDIGGTLDAAAAPCTVNSFTSLASQGYFDDTPCHRLTTSGIFVLQCGDPSGLGTGGPGYAFADELTGAETYPAGTLAMANAGPNTNGSQFFIVYEETPLPPSYTVFGSIDPDGLAVVTEIAAAGTDDANGPGDGAPTTAVDLEFVEIGAETPAEPSGEETSTAPAGACTYVTDGTGGSGEQPVDAPPEEPTATDDVAVTSASSIGRLSLTLDAAAAPCTVGSFVSLADQGYFDGTSCHRLTTQGILVLQCGDPTGTGTGGPGYSFADELTGQETYPSGTLAMANAGPDTNGSQFFIVYGETPLPPSYTVFGTVAPASIKLVQKAARAGVAGGATDGTPKTPVTFTRVTAR